MSVFVLNFYQDSFCTHTNTLSPSKSGLHHLSFCLCDGNSYRDISLLNKSSMCTVSMIACTTRCSSSSLELTQEAQLQNHRNSHLSHAQPWNDCPIAHLHGSVLESSFSQCLFFGNGLVLPEVGGFHSSLAKHITILC